MAAALMNSPAIGVGGGAGGAGKFEFLRFFGCKFKLPMIHAQWVPRPPVTRPSSPRSSPTSNRGTSWTGTAPLGNEAEFELWTVQSGAATSSEGFVTSFLRFPPGRWATLELLCRPSKQGELPENILQNLRNKLPPQTVFWRQLEVVLVTQGTLHAHLD